MSDWLGRDEFLRGCEGPDSFSFAGLPPRVLAFAVICGTRPHPAPPPYMSTTALVRVAEAPGRGAL